MKRKPKQTKISKADSHLYLGETDPARYIHQNKTHRTASEAFRDADYATPIWKCETEWDRVKEYGIFVVIWGLLLAGLYGLYFVDKLFK